MKKIISVLSLVKTIATIFALAASAMLFAAEVAESTSKVSTLSEPIGDAEQGKATASVCMACHGRNGNSTIASNPKLAGQGAQYLLKQMQDYKSGARQDPIMSAQLSGYSDEDLANMATYFSEQETSLGMVKKEYVELGQKIYRGGNEKTGLPACIACHGPAGKGMASAGFPALSGQHMEYTQTQLKAFRAAGRGDHEGKKRSNDAAQGDAAMMQDIAAKMTDDEIRAISSYLSGLR